MRKVHCQGICSLLPRRVLWAWNLTMPLEHVETAIRVLCGFGYKSERMVTSPLFSLFFESVDDKFINLFFFHQIKYQKNYNN